MLSEQTAYTFTDAAPHSEGTAYWLAEIARDGALSWHGPVAVGPAGRALTTVVAPNPFTASTTVSFGLSQRGRVRVSVFDAAGRHIAVLVDAVRDAGEQVITWNGRGPLGLPGEKNGER